MHSAHIKHAKLRMHEITAVLILSMGPFSPENALYLGGSHYHKNVTVLKIQK
jgi:hypothetical protein